MRRRFDKPDPPRYVDPFGQDADATAAIPVQSADKPSLRAAGRLLVLALVVDAWLAIKGILRAARAEPAGMAAALFIGVCIGAAVDVGRMVASPYRAQSTPVYAAPAPANAALAATATAAVTATAPGAAWAPTVGVSADVPASVAQWAPLITEAAGKHGVPVRLLGCMMGQESTGRLGAVSPKGALGLMQVMPATAVEIATERGMLAEHSTGRLQTDPAYNVDLGAYYVAKQYRLYGDWTLALVAYNGGGGAVAKYRAGAPYRETRDYLAAILPCAGVGGGA